MFLLNNTFFIFFEIKKFISIKFINLKKIVFLINLQNKSYFQFIKLSPWERATIFSSNEIARIGKLINNVGNAEYDYRFFI